jgi:hypothetical protein
MLDRLLDSSKVGRFGIVIAENADLYGICHSTY